MNMIYVSQAIHLARGFPPPSVSTETKDVRTERRVNAGDHSSAKARDLQGGKG